MATAPAIRKMPPEAKWPRILLLGLALLAGAAGAGCRRAEPEALKKGRKAESRGDWTEAKRQYAEAITQGSGEGFRQMAVLLLEHDAAELFSAHPEARDARWIAAAESLTAQIRHSAKEAAARGCPVKGVHKALEGYMAAIRDAKAGMVGTGDGPGRSPPDMNGLQARKRRLENELSALSREVGTLERQTEDCARELEAARLQSLREGKQLHREVQGLISRAKDAEDAARRWGGTPYEYWQDSQSPSAEGREIGVRMDIQRQVAAERIGKIIQEKTRLESRLAERRRELSEVKGKLEECERDIARIPNR